MKEASRLFSKRAADLKLEIVVGGATTAQALDQLLLAYDQLEAALKGVLSKGKDGRGARAAAGRGTRGRAVCR